MKKGKAYKTGGVVSGMRMIVLDYDNKERTIRFSGDIGNGTGKWADEYEPI